MITADHLSEGAPPEASTPPFPADPADPADPVPGAPPGAFVDPAPETPGEPAADDLPGGNAEAEGPDEEGSGCASEVPDPFEAVLRSWIASVRQPERPVLEGASQPSDPNLKQVGQTPAELDLLGTLAAIKQEIGLQGRGLRDLVRQLEPLQTLGIEDIPLSRRSLEQVEDRLRREFTGLAGTLGRALAQPGTATVDPDGWVRALAEARAAGRDEGLQELLELRDRLQRGYADARSRLDRLSGWRALWTDRSVLEAVVEGLRLSLDRLEELLRRAEVVEFTTVQGRFDPKRMRAVELDTRADREEGEVLEVLRPGYLRGERLLRLAEVRVNRRPPRS